MTTGHEQGDSGLPHCEPWRRLPFAAKREASWSREGYNRDWRHIAAGEELELADIPGCGFITRLWLALDTHNAARNPVLKVSDPLFLRKMVLRIFWDDADYPSVDVPVGDFFAIGHGAMRSFSSALVDISANPGNGRGSLTSWFRMPFFSRARIVVRNESEQVLRAFWHVDYQRWETAAAGPVPLPRELALRDAVPADATRTRRQGRRQPHRRPQLRRARHDRRGNLHRLPPERGQPRWRLVGRGRRHGVRRRRTVPRLPARHRPGGILRPGLGMQDVQYPWFGTSLFNHGHRNWEGRWSMYRFHVADPDPVPAQRSRHPGARPQQPPHRRLLVHGVLVSEGTEARCPALPAVADRLPRNLTAGPRNRAVGGGTP